MAESHSRCMFTFLRSWWAALWRIPLVYNPICMEEFQVLHTLTNAGCGNPFLFRRSNRCVKRSHFHLNLHFSSNYWCGAYFPLLVCHLYNIFVKCRGEYCCPFLIGLFAFSLFYFEFYIFCVQTLFQKYDFGNIFPRCVACLFIHLIVYLKEQGY